MQPHLGINSVKRYVLLPGDPGRVDRINGFLEEVKEIGMNREFRTSGGMYNGIGVSVVSTGIGCPSAAIAVEELSGCGAETLIRIGTCGGLLKGMKSGDIVIPESALCCDGTTSEYCPGRESADADRGVFRALKEAAEKLGIGYFTGKNRTHDAFYEPTENFIRLSGRGIASSEMECSAVFLVSELRGIRAGAVLVVNTPEPPEEVAENPDIVYRLSDEEAVRRGVSNAIRIALEAVMILEGGRIKRDGGH